MIKTRYGIKEGADPRWGIKGDQTAMLMTTLRQIHCSLDNYQGPLECLYQLVLKREIDIRDVTLREVAHQFSAIVTFPVGQTLEIGAEFVGMLSAMMLLKSRSLLPRHVWSEEEEEQVQQAGLEILNLLVEYCQIKELAKNLSKREEAQGVHYSRGLILEPESRPPPLGIEHLDLEDLGSLFRKVLQSAALMKAHVIQDEEWKVSDKIIYLQHTLREHHRVSLEEAFPLDRGRMELIVTFLALLELLKCGVAEVVRETTTQRVWICHIPEGDSHDK